MQTQSQQGNKKKNKVLVPFYTPPSRLYGPTSAEIIKEARAAVMPTPTIGIRPVFTNRPFTPKDTERTLFGCLKKKSKRPPSTSSGDKNYNFSHLKNSQNQEVSGQVKLPSIESASTRKSHSIFHYSNNLSLDNLTEDYDAETEKIEEVSFEKLPAWKKSYSCPKGGRMIKAASYNELNRLFSAAKALNRDEMGNDESNGSLSTTSSEQKRKNSREKRSKSSVSTIFKENDLSESIEKDSGFYKYLTEITRGSGDHDETVVLDPNLLIRNHVKGLSLKPTKGRKGDIIAKSGSTKKSQPEQLGRPALVEFKSGLDEKNNDQHQENDDGKILADVKIAVKKDANKLNVEENYKVDETEELRNKKDTNLAEKSIGTEPKSQYLISLKEGSRKQVPAEKAVQSIPLEILELYETAEYYGVELHSKENTIGDSHEGTHSKLGFEKKAEKPTTSTDEIKEKITNAEGDKKSDEKHSVKFDKTASNIKKNTSDYENFEMNNKKRYHVSESNEKKQKAYEKWIEKQHVNVPILQNDSQEGWDLFWKNCYFKTTTKDNDKQVQDNVKSQISTDELQLVQRLINRVTVLFKEGGKNSDIYKVNCQMYQLLKSEKLNLDSALKNKILKAFSLHADNEDSEVLLSLARILFYLRVDSTLTAACKMIFNVARFDSNDHLFLNEEDILELFMEAVGRASPIDYAESCVYGYGALKFLTMNYNILSRTLHLGALDLMTLHLKLINTACAENGSVGEQTQHALFQLTGVLRHVAAGEGALPLFITTNCISVICKNLELFQKDEDIVTNISRTLSLVSTDENITQVLMTVENILTLIINLMERYKENDKILIRLSFCLGNIVEHSDLARIQLLRSDTSLTILLNLLKFYIDKDLQISTIQSESNSSCDLDCDVVDDIIVKVIRIIANMSMNPIVGSNLSPVANEKKSLQLSHLLSILLLRKDPGITLLATLGCLNNVSYYCNAHSVLIDITQGIERVLGLNSEDCQAEAARVLGNLTRHKEIRDLIFSTGGVKQLINLLTSKDQEVVRCACGALVNMLLDSDSRKQFIEAKGIDKLVDAIESFSGDWSLAGLAGRAIWNSCADDVSSAALHNNVERLLNTLATSLEEENWNDGDVAWEEFASIATDLLEKINSHLESVQ